MVNTALCDIHYLVPNSTPIVWGQSAITEAKMIKAKLIITIIIKVVGVRRILSSENTAW